MAYQKDGDEPMSDSKANDAEQYREQLSHPDTICLEVYGREFVAIVWEDSTHGLIANLRFGSGRHHTAIDPELDRLLSRDSILGVNVVSMDKARPVEADTDQ